MIRLELSKYFQRRIRQDNITGLSLPTWGLVREAIQAGKIKEALELIDYDCIEAHQSSNRYLSPKDDWLPSSLQRHHQSKNKLGFPTDCE